MGIRIPNIPPVDAPDGCHGQGFVTVDAEADLYRRSSDNPLEKLASTYTIESYVACAGIANGRERRAYQTRQHAAFRLPKVYLKQAATAAETRIAIDCETCPLNPDNQQAAGQID